MVSIDEYADRALGTDVGEYSLSDDRLEAARRLFAATGRDASMTETLAASVFWQAFLSGPSWQRSPHEGLETYVVRHAARRGRVRHDLVVFDPYAHSDESFVADANDRELVAGWDAFQSKCVDIAPEGSSEGNFPGPRRILRRVGGRLAVQARSVFDFRVLIVRVANRPGGREALLTLTSTGSSPIPGIASQAVLVEGTSRSTAGVHAVDSQGRSGFTVAAHSVSEHSTHVSIGARECRVVSRDVLTDSCFVEVPDRPSSIKRTSGPLADILPRQYEPVQFDGVTGGATSTMVTGWTPELPFEIPNCQSRVLTKPDTAEGDSGAALVTTNRGIVGFSLARTGYGLPFAFSAWVWANSVFKAHSLLGARP